MIESRQVRNILDRVFFRISILLVVLAYFALACYWLSVTYRWSLHMIVDLPVYQNLIRETWWLVTFYSSELGLSVGIVLRFIAGIFALYSTVIFLKGGESSLPKIRNMVGATIFFEGLYFLTYAPSAVLGFVYPLAERQNLWYFEPRAPWLIVFLVAGLACLAMVVVIAPSLFKLWLKIVRRASSHEVIKWSCITGVAYLFVMFWFNYTLTWTATLVYWPERAQPGIEILYNPIAITSFLVTVIGLLLIALSALKVTMPAIKGKPDEVDLRKLGYVTMSFGGYFIFMLILYVAAGGYWSQPTTWMEIIGPHNPDLWCVLLVLPGIFLAAKPKTA